MKFKQILKELLNEKKIKRLCWNNNHYWYLKEHELLNSNDEKPTINKAQLKADDWEVFNEFKNPRDEEWLYHIQWIAITYGYTEVLTELKERMGY